ncbi:protein N-terminal asparagine amidohydrolase, putative [Trichophyton benhamiae CBS 112371]|uniref:Protein N-terminal asparagine amidohydrolase, putative n=1 Tax=Arthroderma benhamiae (strain ATCC MYA-4681 / CBS 112371) TaxID=663331 RepID=D4AKD3_ARTBC|nr:protein N-terminal asparagine amidohydrolase, putative [Trichophyton benhamiae CBS 112371]EFE36433.1 protein N-terminal asparagine amidohydrolase, putative [Trichophyton benhamiae CBS 112371]
MRIATFQLRSRLADVEGNIRKADALVGKLDRILQGNGKRKNLDLLVLPEMAFSAVGYPEICPSTLQDNLSLQARTGEDVQGERRFNSLIVVKESGETLVNYRKHHLYYTDDPWAHEGESHESGFFLMPLSTPTKRQSIPKDDSGDASVSSSPKNEIPTTVGICMDINPYKFIASYSACEFATHARTSGAKLVVLSMAWLTLLSSEELSTMADKPDMDTFQYWISRFAPLFLPDEGGVEDSSDEMAEPQVIIVFANRAGEEEGQEGKDTARYAGSSCVVGIRRCPRKVGDEEDGNRVEILIWDMLGATEEGICLVDTDSTPRMVGSVKI